jgi:hypothetical protein
MGNVKIGLTDFKLIDDIQQKQLIGQLYTNKEVSATTFLKLLDIDPKLERERIVADTLEKVKLEHELNMKISKFKNSLATKIDAQITGQPQYDPQQLMQQAMQQAQQVVRVPAEQRKAMLDQIKSTDPMMAVLVGHFMGQLHKQQNSQGAPQSGGSGGAGGSSSSVSPLQSGGGSPSTPKAGN